MWSIFESNIGLTTTNFPVIGRVVTRLVIAIYPLPSKPCIPIVPGESRGNGLIKVMSAAEVRDASVVLRGMHQEAGVVMSHTYTSYDSGSDC